MFLAILVYEYYFPLYWFYILNVIIAIKIIYKRKFLNVKIVLK